MGIESTNKGLADLYHMRVSVDQEHDRGVVLTLARAYHLSVYDGAYLDVALRRTLPIASLDKRLLHTAVDLKITVLK